MEHHEEEKDNKRKLLIIILLILLIISALGIAGYLWQSSSNDIMVSGNSKKGQLPNMSNEDIAAELQREVDASLVSFKINGAPEFENGKSKGSLLIANPEYSAYDMDVYIYNNDTELLYHSGIINPGYYIDYDSLAVELDKGEYKPIAYIRFYSDNEMINEVAVDLNLKVNA